jgi:hypothetical protein
VPFIKRPVPCVGELHFFSIFPAGINRECPIMNEGADEADFRILIPSPSLKKETVGDKEKNKDHPVGISSLFCRKR